MAGPTNNIESKAPKGGGTTCAVTAFDEGRQRQVVTGVFQDVTVTQCQFEAAKAAHQARVDYGATRGENFAKGLDELYQRKGGGLDELRTGYVHLGGHHSQTDIDSGAAGKKGAKALGAGTVYPTAKDSVEVTTAPVRPNEQSQKFNLNM